MSTTTDVPSLYQRLDIRPFINARGFITTLGGSIMPAHVIEAMEEAAARFVYLDEVQEKAGARIAELTGAEAAYVCAGAASGLILAGAACLAGRDKQAIEALPDVQGRADEFVVSIVDEHYHVLQGFRTCGGRLVKVGTREAVTAEDYAEAIGDRTAAAVFFLGQQPREQLPPIVEMAHERGVPVIVDAAAQLPPRANLTDLTAMGADLVVFSGGKAMRGPQCTGLILGRRDLVEACGLNSSPNFAIGRGMKVGKEEIAGLLAAVEHFMEQDEEALIGEWSERCRTIIGAVPRVTGLVADFEPPYANIQGGAHPPASPLVRLRFTEDCRLDAAAVGRALEEGDPSILADASATTLTIGPATLQDGEAEVIGARLREILKA